MRPKFELRSPIPFSALITLYPTIKSLVRLTLTHICKIFTDNCGISKNRVRYMKKSPMVRLTLQQNGALAEISVKFRIDIYTIKKKKIFIRLFCHKTSRILAVSFCNIHKGIYVIVIGSVFHFHLQ